MRWVKAAAATALLGLVLALPPALLISYIGNPWPAGGFTDGFAWTGPISDSAVVGLLAAVVWVLWAQFTLCVSAELLAVLRRGQSGMQGWEHDGARRLPVTFGFQRDLARWTVHGIVAIAVATPAVTLGVDSAGPAAAHPAAAPVATTPANPVTEAAVPPSRDRQRDHDQHTQRADQSDQRHDPRQHAGQAPAADGQQFRTAVVGHLDNLYTIAQTHLGDGERWPEIARLNLGRTMSDGRVFTDPEGIEEGWQLRIPSATGDTAGDATTSGRAHVVEPGESLSQIALEELGDATRWPDLYRQNRDVVGANPDLIQPGQVIELPSGRRSHHEHTPASIGAPAAPTTGQQPGRRGGTDRTDGQHPNQAPDRAASQAPEAAPRTHARPEVPAPSGTSDTTTPGSSGAQTTPATPDSASGIATAQADEGGFSALRALLASAVCLAFGTAALIVANRRRQLRHRRPGRMIAATPEFLIAAERAVIETGAAAQPDVEFLDRALRHVAATCHAARMPLPRLGAAVLGSEDLTLLFTQPAIGEVPIGWTATEDAQAWVLPRDTILEEELLAQPAPYPALVTIGRDAEGGTWLLDLESSGDFGIAGAIDQVADLTRFLVAELAVNAWSEGAEVLLVDGFGAETVKLNPARLRQVGQDVAFRRAAALTRAAALSAQNLGTDLLERRRDGDLLDSTGPVVIAVPSPRTGEQLDEELLDIVSDRDRPRVVVVHESQTDPVVELTDDGPAYLPRWGITIEAFTLPGGDAEAMAALVASTRNLQDAPVPDATAEPEADSADAADADFGDAAGSLSRFVRADGSLRGEFIEPRHTDGGDASSVLPEADEVYLTAGASTRDDLAALAPSVPAATRAELEALDPTLDQDLADWFDPTSPRPKVQLLGPVDVTARTGDREGIANLGGTIEFVVYLACQERGVTGGRAAEAFGWKTVKTVQNRARDARKLLGTRPDGAEWLPEAGKTESARRGVPTYELDRGPGGVLISNDLFVRLKIRAQQRGDAGIEDLIAALSLVTGEPFDRLRRGGYGWLLEGQRHDHIMVGAIHDVAHLVATRALADRDTDLVHQACEVARKASPDSDLAWLDLAAAAEAENGPAAADEMVREQVIDRVDEDLPPRTESVIDRRRWLAG